MKKVQKKIKAVKLPKYAQSLTGLHFVIKEDVKRGDWNISLLDDTGKVVLHKDKLASEADARDFAASIEDLDAFTPITLGSDMPKGDHVHVYPNADGTFSWKIMTGTGGGKPETDLAYSARNDYATSDDAKADAVEVLKMRSDAKIIVGPLVTPTGTGGLTLSYGRRGHIGKLPARQPHAKPVITTLPVRRPVITKPSYPGAPPRPLKPAVKPVSKPAMKPGSFVPAKGPDARGIPAQPRGTGQPALPRPGLESAQPQKPFKLPTPIPGVEMFTLTVAKTGTGKGWVGSVPAGIESVGAARFPSNMTVKLKATADRGSRFVEWRGVNTQAGIQAQVKMNSNKTVVAIFNLIA